MIVVTGGAGFIGSQLVAGLNKAGYDKIVVVDNLTNGHKFFNLVENSIVDYFDKYEFRDMLDAQAPICDEITAVFHQGACSITTEWDGQYMMDNNYSYSKVLFHFTQQKEIPFIYASSAAVYGLNTKFTEEKINEKPINVYGYSKLLFDNYIRSRSESIQSQVAGLRYFNVYGAGENHKESMASVMFHFNNQLNQNDEVKLFQGSHGYENGEQLRDFVFVEDVVSVNLWLLENPEVSGIFNVGTGKARSFNDVADLVIKWHGRGEKKYIPFPDRLLGSYQSYTQADLTALNAAGYKKNFQPIEQGVETYLHHLNNQ